MCVILAFLILICSIFAPSETDVFISLKKKPDFCCTSNTSIKKEHVKTTYLKESDIGVIAYNSVIQDSTLKEIDFIVNKI